MIRRLFVAYQLELFRSLRSKYTYIGPAFVALAAAVMAAFHPFTHDSVADYGFISAATTAALNWLGLLLLLLFSAGLAAPEMGGAMRLALVRPLYRIELLAAKFFLGVTYALFLSLAAGVVAWAAAYVFGDLGGVYYGEELIYTSADMGNTYLIAALLALVPQAAAVAYALFFSVCTRNAIAAVTLTLALWVVQELAKYAAGIETWFFSTYLERPWEVFALRADGLDASWVSVLRDSLPASGVGVLVFGAAAALVFTRRDLA